MTASTHPTAPRDFAIEVAENEGMPSRSIATGRPPKPAPTRRLTGTLTLGPSMARAAAGGLWSASEQAAMRHHKEPARRAPARLIARVAVVAGVIASFAFPVLAQDGTGPIPENAQPRGHGGGWVCDLGFRQEGADCLALHMPAHSHPTGRSYGTGWECDRGYVETNGASCDPIPVPENAFLRSSGHEWQCDRGYLRDRDACVPILLPEHAYLTDDPAGTGWTCDRGYAALEGTCLPIAVPANAYLTNASFGPVWACERGFVRNDDRCDAIPLPANAFLDPISHEPGWRCERGYEPLNGACAALVLPANAHLDRSGNRWTCDRGFRLSDGVCSLAR
ncbi:hypothetical protein [Roseicyclus persicicus]|uniref:MSP1 EGF domain 1 n=1 Tax=Roseicyclus persicicus TaxID=2650661 RepID=A0A7X6GXY7_9RHOB|nr:hypothetical protein [Roseibacterium persicicum]NKX44466.1 hypothetical protein [Roseibacterium persicicum]